MVEVKLMKHVILSSHVQTSYWEKVESIHFIIIHLLSSVDLSILTSLNYNFE